MKITTPFIARAIKATEDQVLIKNNNFVLLDQFKKAVYWYDKKRSIIINDQLKADFNALDKHFQELGYEIITFMINNTVEGSGSNLMKVYRYRDDKYFKQSADTFINGLRDSIIKRDKLQSIIRQKYNPPFVDTVNLVNYDYLLRSVSAEQKGFMLHHEVLTKMLFNCLGYTSMTVPFYPIRGYRPELIYVHNNLNGDMQGIGKLINSMLRTADPSIDNPALQLLEVVLDRMYDERLTLFAFDDIREYILNNFSSHVVKFYESLPPKDLDLALDHLGYIRDDMQIYQLMIAVCIKKTLVKPLDIEWAKFWYATNLGYVVKQPDVPQETCMERNEVRIYRTIP